MKSEVLKSWSLEIDYSRAPCLGANQKARGLWERDCVRRAELAHAQWNSRRLLAVVSLSFGVGETNCSQGTGNKAPGSHRKEDERRSLLWVVKRPASLKGAED